MMSTQRRSTHRSKSYCIVFILLGLLNMHGTAQQLHDTPICNAGQQTYSLNWGPGSDQYDWLPAGSLTQTFINVDNSGHTFTFTYIGATGDLTPISGQESPAITSFFSDGSVNVLGQYADILTGEVLPIGIQVDIFPPIRAHLAFELYHINASARSGDQMTISASYKGGTPIYPTFTANATPSWSQPQTGTINPINSSTGANNDQAGVNFDSDALIDQLYIQWEGCDGCMAGDRGFGLGPITFCTPGPDRDQDGITDANDIDDDNDGIPDVFEVCHNTPIPPPPDSSLLTFRIQLDAFPDENEWSFKNAEGIIVASGGPYNRVEYSRDFLIEEIRLPLGTYTFEITDRFWNGICCTAGPGYYEILIDNKLIIGGTGNGSFGASDTATFNTADIPASPFYCYGRDPMADDDDDRIPNYQDSDFCTLNAKGVCESMDTDSDGVPDFFDLDSDNDGIPDLVEAGGVDADGDGRVDNLTDLDGDGLADLVDNNRQDGPLIAGNCAYFPDCLFRTSTSKLLDQNGDGTTDRVQNNDRDLLPAFIDLDADDDGLPDVVEAKGADTDGNGLLDGLAFGANGYNDLFDPSDGGTPLFATFTGDTDGDGAPDFLDVDADDDGIFDNYEAQATGAYIAPGILDTDGDGLLDAYDNLIGYGGKGIDNNTATTVADLYDHDLDFLPDYLDKDSDGDNIPDQQEAWDGLMDGDSKADNLADCLAVDADGDGLRACYDADDHDASNINWAASPADDDGSTDGGMIASVGQLFSMGSSLDLLLPDNGGEAGEPDFRDVLIECSVPRMYYALTEQAPSTNTDYEFDPITGQHGNGEGSGIVRATSSCVPNSDGWHYYYNPLEPENYLFSIRYSDGSPDSIPLSELVDYIEIKTIANPADRFVENSASATLVMARDWELVLKAVPEAGSQFDIKFYFQPSELQILATKADELEAAYPRAVRSTLQWFKKAGGVINSEITPTGIDDIQDITAFATEVFDESMGTSQNGAAASTDGDASEAGNGKNYIEFKNLESFSGGTAMIKVDFEALPVELTRFEGKAAGCDVHLDWVTDLEDHFSHFELEYSSDGFSFEKISQMNGQSVGGAGYHFLDQQAGALNYYRLKMIDLDGSYRWSDVIVVATNCAKASTGLELYPNPISQKDPVLKIKINSHRPIANLIVMDVLGHQLIRKTLAVEKGWNALDMDVSQLAPGMYFILHLEGRAELAQAFVVTEK